MAYDNIIVEIADNIATLTLNRPKRLNSLNIGLVGEMAAAIKLLNADDDVKVLILTGAGEAFCTGADFSSEVAVTDRKQANMNRQVRTAPFASLGWGTMQIAGFSKPVVAAINGYAVGAGLAYALAADIRIASDKAAFSAIFIKRGLVPDAGISFYLPRLVGVSKALELMWTCDMIDAQEALRIGVVNRVVPHDELMEATRDFALRLAKGPSLAIEMAKRMAYSSSNTDSLIMQMSVEDYMQNVCTGSEDALEGVVAFLEKREPRFKGR
ncbi:MAG: enoyl-CoA hydratase-related protein [Dehalococcoidia bacterium]|nr:enoyl-CoA hydratase-related protein [Dehalococcoidia bacterium]MDD5493203.1 enoyl-CoA hydratase-related protein [Dehalococcoidia bacterium]